MPWYRQAKKDALILAKSLGELKRDYDPGVSEWANPIEQTSIIYI